MNQTTGKEIVLGRPAITIMLPKKRGFQENPFDREAGLPGGWRHPESGSETLICLMHRYSKFRFAFVKAPIDGRFADCPTLPQR